MKHGMMKHLKCVKCKNTYEMGSLLTCPNCGDQGILDVIYDYEVIGKMITKESLSKNFEYSMFRYRYLLPIDDAYISQMLKTGWTPLYRAHHLEARLGIRKLYIKDESQNPSGSLKDRASAIAVLKAIEEGYQTICCSSTGNAASSLAAHAARMGLSSYIFIPRRAPIGKINQLLIYGANVILVDGDYKDAFKISKEAIHHFGWYNRNAAINPYMVEGKKTATFEILEQLNFKPTDWIILSVGDGCTIASVYKAIQDFKKIGLITKTPRILGVQSEGCAPFVKAFELDQAITEAEEKTLADSISVGIPRNPIKALRAVRKTQGAFIGVSDEAILSAMKTLGKYEGLFAEPASAAALAGLELALKKGIIKSNETAVMMHTGHGLKDPINAEKAVGSPTLLKPSLQDLITHLNERNDDHA